MCLYVSGRVLVPRLAGTPTAGGGGGSRGGQRAGPGSRECLPTRGRGDLGGFERACAEPLCRPSPARPSPPPPQPRVVLGFPGPSGPCSVATGDDTGLRPGSSWPARPPAQLALPIVIGTVEPLPPLVLHLPVPSISSGPLCFSSRVSAPGRRDGVADEHMCSCMRGC